MLSSKYPACKFVSGIKSASAFMRYHDKIPFPSPCGRVGYGINSDQRPARSHMSHVEAEHLIASAKPLKGSSLSILVTGNMQEHSVSLHDSDEQSLRTTSDWAGSVNQKQTFASSSYQDAGAVCCQSETYPLLPNIPGSLPQPPSCLSRLYPATLSQICLKV